MKTILFSVLFSFFMTITSCNYEDKADSDLVNIEYDASTALKMALFSKYAYESTGISTKGSSDTDLLTASVIDYEIIQKELESKIKADELTKDFDLIWLGITDDKENLTFVAKSKSGKNTNLVISSRGTIFSLSDIVEDLDVYQLVNFSSDLSEDIKISSGINIAIQKTISIRSEVFGNSKKLTIEDVVLSEISNSEKTTIYLAGHSLGGAISTVLGLRFAQNFRSSLESNKLSLSIYNIAGQTSGNEAFRTYYRSLLADTKISFSHHRIANSHDVVPYAFDNLDGIESNGYDYSNLGLLEIKALIASISALFDLENKNYRHAGGNFILLNSTLPPEGCETKVKGLGVFKCWAAKEHAIDNYIKLLKSANK